MSKPTIATLNEILHDLTENWQHFALYLPGIKQSDIETITIENEKHLAKQKLALYNKWLQVYPDASWDDVIKALKNPALRENAIAQRVRDKYCQVKSDEVVVSPSPSSVIMFIPKEGQSSTDEVEVSQDIVKELNQLHESFVDLTRDVKTEVKRKVENEDMELASVTYSLQEERAFPLPSLQSVSTTDELFHAIHPHYNFLNCHLIISIAFHFLFGTIVEKATKYKKKVEKFMKTTRIRYFRNALKPYYCRTIQSSLNTIPVEVVVPNYWDQQNVWLVRMLVKTLFPVKDPDELPWYNITSGSVIMTFIALEHMTSSLIKSGRQKTKFMRLIGLISLKIGDKLVWDKKDEENESKFSFEESLIQATLDNNMEAVQFILQCTQVNINTRNTNGTLIEALKTMYISESDIAYKLITFHATFDCIQTNIELLVTTTSSDDVNYTIPWDNFFNGRKLAGIELLDQQLSNQLNSYIEMVDGYKRLFPVHYLQKLLPEYFPTSFPGNVEVTISLHIVWSTCSIWYIEQLGQLIFTPALFYQLQWFRVDNYSEVLVKICLLADGKIISSLEGCLNDNESRTSMLGIISVQVNDSAMIVNDFSNGYTFNDAVELAKAIGDDEVSNLLQQIRQSPVDYEDIATPPDENNNYCFIPHPDSTPLMIACCNDNSQLVQLLLDHNANPNIQNKKQKTALIYSTRSNKIFEMLLDHGADIYKAKFTVMHSACIVGNIKNVETLIANCCALVNTLDGVKQAPLTVASRYGHAAVVEKLLEVHADPNIQDNEGWTALEAASRYGHTAVVELLLQARIEPDIQDNNGWTALKAASRYGNATVVELLLEARADPNIEDNEGWTALESASRYGHSAVVELLLQAHIDPNIQDNNGCTPLEAASTYGHTAVVELLLLQARVNPNIQDNEGWTALMYACIEGHSEIVELLLQAGADSAFRTHDGYTALDLAIEYNHNEIIELLCQAMFDVKH